MPILLLPLFTAFFRDLAYRHGSGGFSNLQPQNCWRVPMNLDVNTLFLVTIYVEAILGLLLLFAWAQKNAITAVAWWVFAHLLRAASVTLFGLYGSVSDIISIDLANAILFTSFAVTWTGARLFDHRKPQFVLLFAGAALWLLARPVPGVSQPPQLRGCGWCRLVTAFTLGRAH